MCQIWIVRDNAFSANFGGLFLAYSSKKEWGKIAKSNFVLEYVDSLELRQAIEKQLKGESSNRFSKAVSFGNNQEFQQGDKVEQEVAEGCKRLIKNAIICWNCLYASRRIADEQNEQRKRELITALRNGSVVTWQHINMHGEYDFADEKLQDSIGLRVPKDVGAFVFERREPEIVASFCCGKS